MSSDDRQQNSDYDRWAADRQRVVKRRNERERARLLREWLASGGSEDDFNDAWPDIQTQLGRIRMMEVGDRARQRSLRVFRSGN